VNQIDTNRIDTGSGIRSLAKDGVYVHDYQIVVPKELAYLWR
jgi:hypothetical protein